ncbi:MAG: flagellar filament capping protein FliD [Lachnospiraceae bacterium]|nr:flagellar filament capping protein FliD [Lachnospiraceae bacterium]
MAIRMTGMVSGMDTESIIQSLVEAQQTKNKKTTDKKQKLEWQQEIWKELNTKLVKFTQNSISKMRLQSSYGTKKVSSTNESKVKISASSNAPLGSQTLQIEKLAKSGYLTGAEITTESGGTVTSSTKMSELGIAEGSQISLKSGDTTKDITITENMTVAELTKQMKEAGVNVNFDSNQNRFYISSKNSGSKNDFTLTASDSSGINALQKLGLITAQLSENEKKQYKMWADAAPDGADDDTIFANIMANDELKKSYDAKVTELTDYYTAQKEKKAKELENLNTAKDSLQEEMDALNAIDYTDDDTLQEFIDNNTDLMFEINDEFDALPADQQTEAKRKEMRIAKANELLDAQKADKQAEIDVKQQEIDDKQAEITDITDNKLNGADGNEGILEEAKASVIDRAKVAKSILAAGTIAAADYDGKFATKIDGEDAKFTLNNVEYTSATNDTTINGVSLTLTGTTGPDEVINFTISNDTEGVYNMVKDFIKEYNELLDEMNELYYADKAKGYEPLTDDEKDAMSEKEVEKWEKKIKDSLLRRDDTLSGITSTMRSITTSMIDYNGKKYSLSSFGIVTSSDYTEKGKLHIMGDEDDSTYASSTNKLKEALENDPDAVMEVLTGVMSKFYSAMQDKMKKTSMSSAMTFYNDTYMKNQLTSLNTKIKSDEKKLTALEDKYYKQFSAMEVAMQKMQQQSSYLTSLFGG